MTFKFTEEQLDNIREAVNAIKADPQANWLPAYDAVVKALDEAQAMGLIAEEDMVC